MDNNDMNEASSSEEDKKFASEAVKFVIGHTRNGFVSLCASVATLFKEKALLETENEVLKKEVKKLKEAGCSVSDSHISEALKEKNDNCFASKICLDFDKIKSFKLERKNVFSDYMPIKNCLCYKCIEEFADLEGISPPLEKGNRVIVAGEMCGSVEYVGHVDNLCFPDIFVGLNLDEAVGDCTGTFSGKTYFVVQPNHGLFISLLNVCCVL